MKQIRNLFQNESKAIYVILISSFLIFFHHLYEQGFFLDGMIYAALSKNAAVLGYWLVPHLTPSMLPRFNDHIPFIFILQGLFFKFFGASFFTARFFINLFSLFFVTFLFKSTKHVLKESKIAVCSVFFILITLPLLKQSRFPNLDVPLLLFNFMGVTFYYFAISKSKKFYWYLSGICFGLAMLTKGPMAIFIPGTIFLHLIFTKNYNRLLNIHPWLSLVLGFIIFSLWPISLYLTGNFEIFQRYFRFTIIDTIAGSRGVTKNDYFLYVRHLLTFCIIHILFLGYGIIKYVKNKKRDDFYLLHLIMFFFILLLTSKMTFKFSHYILSLYGSMAILAAYGFNELRIKNLTYYLKIFLIVVGVLVFLIPNKKIRDKEVYDVLPEIDKLKLDLKTYYDVNGAYEYWTLTPLLNFHDGSDTKEVKLADFSKIDQELGNKIIFIKNEDANNLNLENWKKIAEMPVRKVGIYLKN